MAVLFSSTKGPNVPLVCLTGMISPSMKFPLESTVILKIGAIPLLPFKLNFPYVAKFPAL
jgi:hypothetical protein